MLNVRRKMIELWGRWSLRRKLGLLLAVYLLLIILNLAIASFCILVYFRPVLAEARQDLIGQQAIMQIRQLLNQQSRLVEQRSSRTVPQVQGLEEKIWDIHQSLMPVMDVSELQNLWPRIRQETRHHRELIGRLSAEDTDAEEVITDLMASTQRLDVLWGQANRRVAAERETHVSAAADIQQQVVLVMMITTLTGTILCLGGWLLVRKWMMAPLAGINEATRHYTLGRLDYRMNITTRDELGELGRELHEMAGQIMILQAEKVDQVRTQAVEEMLENLETRMGTAIRAIRQQFEATAEQTDHHRDPDLFQGRVISALDQCDRWLQQLKDALSPSRNRFQPVDIRELLNGIVMSLQPLLIREKVAITIEQDSAVETLQVDPLHVEQALLALVTNAVEASPPGQTVHLGTRLQANGQNGQEVAITVEDHGSGIPPEIKERILLPFFSTKPNGNGIGLAMVQAVVRLHDGRLSVQSEPGQGSRFTIFLPLDRTHSIGQV